MRTPHRTFGGSSLKTDAQNEVSLPSSGGCWNAIALETPSQVEPIALHMN